MALCINFPTILTTTFPSLAHALSCVLNRKEGPSGCGVGLTETHLYVHRGHTRLQLPLEHARELRDQLGARRLTFLFKLLPKVLFATFVAARRDTLAGVAPGGGFAYSARRICRLCGMDPDTSQLASVEAALKILGELELYTTIKNAEHEIRGLVKPLDQTRELPGELIDDGYHRGGTWRLGAINPHLTKLTKNRFCQLSEEALELSPYAFNVLVAIEGQAACRARESTTLAEARMITDAALEETTTRGSARARRKLDKLVCELIDRGHLLARKVLETGKWFLQLAPKSLLQVAREAQKSAAPPGSEPKSLLQRSVEALVYQALEGAKSVSSITLRRSDDSTCHHHLPSEMMALSEKGGSPAPG